MGERTRKTYSSFVTDEIKECITAFYRDDSNSRILAGMSNCIMQKVPGAPSIPISKRMLLYDLKPLYYKWRSQTNFEKVPCKTIFASLKPKKCIFPGEPGTHNICVCEQHQNVKLKLAAIHPHTDYTDAIESGVCSINNRDCMFQQCKNCKKMDGILKFVTSGLDINTQKYVTFLNWVSEKIPNKKDESKKFISRATLKSITEPFDKFISDLCKDLLNLMRHHFINEATKAYFDKCKKNLVKDTGILVSDFAENFSFLAQGSIQRQYFNNKQASLFTSVLYYKDEKTNKLKCSSFCVISDCMEHISYSVHIYLQTILNCIRNKLPSLRKMIYFTDGAPTQFKNK